MALYSPLRALINSWSEVTTLLTTNPESNDKPIRPERLFESDQLPAITIEHPDEEFEDDLQTDQSRTESKIIINVVDEDVETVNTIIEKLLSRGTSPPTGLIGYRGTTGGTYIDNISIEKIRRRFWTLPDGSETGEYVASIHCTVCIRR